MCIRDRFKVSVRNYSDLVISDVKVRLELREHVRIVKILPEVYAREGYAYIPCMVPGQKQSVDFYLEPFICSSIPVEVVVFYRDARGRLQTVTREPKFVSTKCPTVVAPEEINYANLDNLFRNVLGFRAHRRLPSANKFKFLYEIVIESLEMWAGRCVKRVYREKPFKADAYFMIMPREVQSELKKQNIIVLKVEVDEEKDFGAIFVAAERQDMVVGVLTHIWNDLVKPKLIKECGVKSKILRCQECGGPLKDRDIRVGRCKYCNSLVGIEM